MLMNHRRAACLWLLLGTAWMTTGRTLAQSFPVTMEGYSAVSQFTPAPVRSTAPLAAPYRAVCVGTNLQVVDESDPANVRIVSQMTLPGPALDLLVRDSTLYIADGTFGLILVNVSNPLAPSYLSGFKSINALALAMNEGGKVLYVSDGSSQFQSVNVSDPLRPKHASYTYVPKANIFDLAVINQTLIVACGGKGLVIYNLARPGIPLEVKRFSELKGANRISIDPVSGTLVAVADADLGLALVNFPSWRTPVLKGSLSFPTQAMDVEFLPGKDQVVVALGSGGYAVVDVTSPSAPVALSQPTTPAPALNVTTAGTRPYLLCSGSGLFSLDASNPAHPVTTLAVAGQEVFGALAVTGSTVYVTRGQAIQIWNYADPAHPALVGSVPTPAEALDLMVSGDLLMAACQDHGVLFFDISNPAVPGPLSTFPVNGSAGQMALSGNLLAIADGTDGVVLVDIAIPSAPVAAGTPWNTAIGYVGGVAFSGPTTLWARQSSNGLTSLDVTNTSAINELGKLAVDGNAGRLYSYSNYIVCMNGYLGWEIVDAADPAKPLKVAGQTSGGGLHAAFSGATMLSCDGNTGFREYDLSAPTVPVLKAFFGAPTFSYQSAFLPDGTRLLSCREGGLWSLVPTSCAGTKLLFPCEGSELSRFNRASFIWQAVEGDHYVVQVSKEPTFPEGRKKTKTSETTTSSLNVPFWEPSDAVWQSLIKLARERTTLYWRVIYKLNKNKAYSETRTITIP